jgi:hypothetical protein
MMKNSLLMCTYLITALFMASTLPVLYVVEHAAALRDHVNDRAIAVSSSEGELPVRVFIHTYVWDVINFVPLRHKVLHDVPMAIWNRSTAALRPHDTLQYSYDMHDAGQCTVDSIAYRDSNVVNMYLSDGSLRLRVSVVMNQSGLLTERISPTMFFAVQSDPNVASVEAALASTLARVLTRDTSMHSTVRVRADTVEICDRKNRCIAFRLWIDMLRTQRVGGFVTEDVVTSRRVIQRGEVLFITKIGGKFHLMESKGLQGSEDPDEYQVGDEIAGF